MGPKNKEDSIYARLFPIKNRKGQLAKQRIINAAIASIADEGIENLTFQSVGTRLAMGATQVRYHFNDKNDLISTSIDFVVITYQENVLKKLAKAKGWQGQVRSVIDGTFDWIEKNPEQRAIYLAFLYFASSKPRYQEKHTQMFESGVRRMTQILLQAGTKPALTENDVNDISVSLWGTLDGILIYSLTTELKKPRRWFRDQAMKAISSLLKAHGFSLDSK